MSEEEKYALKYKIDFETRPQGFGKEETYKLKENEGLADALFFVSILNFGDQFTLFSSSMDGETNSQVSGETLFAIWIMLADEILKKGNLDQVKLECCFKSLEYAYNLHTKFSSLKAEIKYNEAGIPYVTSKEEK